MEYDIYVDPSRISGGLALWWTSEVQAIILHEHNDLMTIQILLDARRTITPFTVRLEDDRDHGCVLVISMIYARAWRNPSKNQPL